MTTWRRTAAIGLHRTFAADADHMVREYINRLAIWRKDGQRMSWDELQAVKQLVWGDRVAVEVYPAASRVVNLRNTRHLWWSGKLADAVTAECRHEEFGG